MHGEELLTLIHVLTTDSPIQQVQVEFLDYGGSELVSLSSLKHLPEKCRHLPFQAVKASLDGE